MYRIDVKYKTFEGWSQTYTYKSKYPYQKETAVVVPTGKFYSTAKVVSCEENGEFPVNVVIRHIIGSVDELKNLHRED